MHSFGTDDKRHDAKTPDDASTMPRILTRHGAAERRDFVSGLNEAISSNPVPAALIGMGVVWMFMGGKNTGGKKASIGDAFSRDMTRSFMGSAAKHAAAVGQSIKTAADGAVSSTTSAIASAADGIANTASSVGHSLMPEKSPPSHVGREIDRYRVGGSHPSRSRYGDLRQSLAELFEQRPILLGAAGLALGAGIAASLPATEAERQALGKASARVHGKTSEIAAQVKDMASAAMDELQQRGLDQPASGDESSEASRQSI